MGHLIPFETKDLVVCNNDHVTCGSCIKLADRPDLCSICRVEGTRSARVFQQLTNEVPKNFFVNCANSGCDLKMAYQDKTYARPGFLCDELKMRCPSTYHPLRQGLDVNEEDVECR